MTRFPVRFLCGVLLALPWAGCAARQTSPAPANPRFDTVVSHLDTGGPLFLYWERPGDVVTATVNNLPDELKKQVAPWEKVLAADALQAVGTSVAVEDGDYSRQSTFFLIDGDFPGIWGVFDVPPRPALLPDLVSPDVVAGIETTIDAADLVAWVHKIDPSFTQTLSSSEMLRPLASLLDRLTTVRIAVALFPPSTTAEGDIPLENALLVAEGLQPEGVSLIDIIRKANTMGLLRIRSTPDWHIVSGPEGLSRFPTLRIDRHADRIFVATSADLLADILDPKAPKLRDDPQFRRLARDLPLNACNALAVVLNTDAVASSNASSLPLFGEKPSVSVLQRVDTGLWVRSRLAQRDINTAIGQRIARIIGAALQWSGALLDEDTGQE